MAIKITDNIVNNNVGGGILINVPHDADLEVARNRAEGNGGLGLDVRIDYSELIKKAEAVKDPALRAKLLAAVGALAKGVATAGMIALIKHELGWIG